MLTVLLSTLMIFSSIAFAAPSVRLQMNGQFHDDYQPMLKNGRTLVPLAFISKQLGFDVKWMAQEKKVIVSGSKNIELKIGDKNAMIDGSKKTISEAPQIFNGKTYVPLAFIAETFGIPVHWDAKNKIVTIGEGKMTDQGEKDTGSDASKPSDKTSKKIPSYDKNSGSTLLGNDRYGYVKLGGEWIEYTALTGEKHFFGEGSSLECLAYFSGANNILIGIDHMDVSGLGISRDKYLEHMFSGEFPNNTLTTFAGSKAIVEKDRKVSTEDGVKTETATVEWKFLTKDGLLHFVSVQGDPKEVDEIAAKIVSDFSFKRPAE